MKSTRYGSTMILKGQSQTGQFFGHGHYAYNNLTNGLPTFTAHNGIKIFAQLPWAPGSTFSLYGLKLS